MDIFDKHVSIDYRRTAEAGITATFTTRLITFDMGGVFLLYLISIEPESEARQDRYPRKPKGGACCCHY